MNIVQDNQIKHEKNKGYEVLEENKQKRKVFKTCGAKRERLRDEIFRRKLAMACKGKELCWKYKMREKNKLVVIRSYSIPWVKKRAKKLKDRQTDTELCCCGSGVLGFEFPSFLRFALQW